MNANGSILQTPFHASHSHFFDYITDFPGLHAGDSHEENHKKIMKKLRQQILETPATPYGLQACYRNCFKLPKKTYVEFCLEKKCNGAKLSEAANVLGYLKKRELSPPKKEHHSH